MAQNRFKQLREEHGFSQIELGNRLGVTQQSVFAWVSDTPKMEEPAVSDGELRNATYNRIRTLPEPVLARVLDLIDAIQSYRVSDSKVQAPRGSYDPNDPE